MQRERISITFEIDLDPIPGACHEPSYWKDWLVRTLPSWYNPTVNEPKLVREAPAIEAQITQLANQVIAESACIEMVDFLMGLSIGYGAINHHAEINNLTFEQALIDLFNIHGGKLQ